MTHFTHTGPNAGEPICGAPRNDDDDYYHATYWKEYLYHWKRDPPSIREIICPECWEIINDVYEGAAADRADAIRDRQLEMEYEED